MYLKQFYFLQNFMIRVIIDIKSITVKYYFTHEIVKATFLTAPTVGFSGSVCCCLATVVLKCGSVGSFSHCNWLLKSEKTNKLRKTEPSHHWEDSLNNSPVSL